MSMPSLLSHFGLDTARFVTTTGQIIFDGVTKSGTGFSHAIHGAVTPVAPHTFHGGAEEPDDLHEETAVWWDDPAQIKRHVVAMEQAFPSFVYVPPEDDIGPCWGGTIDTGRGKFRLGVFARRDRGLPRIVVFGHQLGVYAGGRWVPAEHLYLNGNLCVADRGDWAPDEHTVAIAVGWAAHWLAAYTEWRMSRRWPAEGVRAVAS